VVAQCNPFFVLALLPVVIQNLNTIEHPNKSVKIYNAGSFLQKTIWPPDVWQLRFMLFLSIQVALASFFAWRAIAFVVNYETSFAVTKSYEMDCRPQSSSCRSLYQQYPNRSMHCLKNTNLKVCSQKCFNTPPSLKTLDASRDFENLWPPTIGQGNWIRDKEYCRRPTNPLYPCLMSNYC
jgi:hypothetical protein